MRDILVLLHRGQCYIQLELIKLIAFVNCILGEALSAIPLIFKCVFGFPLHCLRMTHARSLSSISVTVQGWPAC